MIGLCFKIEIQEFRGKGTRMVFSLGGRMEDFEDGARQTVIFLRTKYGVKTILDKGGGT